MITFTCHHVLCNGDRSCIFSVIMPVVSPCLVQWGPFMYRLGRGMGDGIKTGRGYINGEWYGALIQWNCADNSELEACRG